MRNINIIAFFGLSLFCSPQAFGQDALYMMSHWAIEQKLEQTETTQEVAKKHPFPKKHNLPILSSVFHIGFILPINRQGFHDKKPVVVDCRQYIRPKIIEFAA